MSKKKASPAAKRLGKRAAKYSEKLKTLRKFTSEFDAKKFDRVYKSAPRTEKSRRERKAILQKVSRTFSRVRPFAHRPHKLVRPTSKENFESLREFVGLPKFKKLKAIPVPTDRGGKLKVTFDKKHRVKLREGNAQWKVFLFPHKPRNHYKGGKLVTTAVEDIEEMTAALVKTMPPGMYVLMSRHHFLVPTVTDREGLLATVRGFMNQYKGSPEFLKLLYGFKWISGSYERAQEFQTYMKTERGRMKLERRRVSLEKKARVIAEMDRAFKRGKISRRAKITGRA